MRISDWSSDVCSSDLGGIGARRAAVACRRDEADGSIWLETSHDGYLPVFGLTHHRRLFLSASGDDLRGEDRFTAETSGAARPCDVALRFHLHPEVQAMAAQDGRSVVLRLPKGSGWRMRSAGATLALEPSVYLGQPRSEEHTSELVLSGRAESGETVA